MRVNEDAGQVYANGHAASSNGSTPRKPLQMNGHTSSALNGSSPSFTNGTGKKLSPVRPPTYRGHNREEVVRIMIQGLLDMGYPDAANVLSSESQFELESPAVAAFRSAILEGIWAEAEAILLGSPPSGSHLDDDQFSEGLVLAEGADRSQMLFWIRQQKFLELLDRRDLGVALMVLRQELTPLGHDIHQLHALSTLLMCPPEDLRSKAHWPGSVEESRKMLLQDLSRSVAPSVMIRDHRLAELFDQVKQNQINQCLYHNTPLPPSLYADHHCDRDDFPSRTFLQLEDHTGEVWHVQFSHDGTKLATASQDRSVNIYETVTFKRLHTLTQHSGEVTYVAWSPDDSKIITCSQDCKARVFDVESGRLRATLEHQTVEQNYAITAAAWGPDSMTFVTASHDRGSQLCHWNLRSSEMNPPAHTWPPGFRVQDVAITDDGHWLVALDSQNIIRIFDLNTYREEPPIRSAGKMTGITLSRDGNSVLVNLAIGEVHIIDLVTRDIIRKFRGQKQGEFVIRSCFGGAAENFVVSGSEDGDIYVWHKENEALIEKLSGHGRGQSGKQCVTTVDWNPRDAGMFASGGDDRKVRIWTNTLSPIEGLAPSLTRSVSIVARKRETCGGQGSTPDPGTYYTIIIYVMGSMDLASTKSLPKIAAWETFPPKPDLTTPMSTKPTPASKPVPKPKPKPHLPFLFGRQDQPPAATATIPRTKRVSSATASSQDLASIAHSHPHPPAALDINNPQHTQHRHPNDPPLHHQSLELALEISARSSIDSNCSDLLHDFIPLTFAPTMAASPAGGGHSINVNDPTLIALVNKLQDVFTTVGVANPIDLPQIVVVGSQSSGKSSVLENIVGRDFLPRGAGIVTRRPLVLQLIHRPVPAKLQTNGVSDKDLQNSTDSQANVDEWGEFLHLPAQKFHDFNKIRDEIVKETEAKAGRNVGISPAPINLRIYSPNVLTLTLVDLPGLTKVPVGDQPRDIERQIKDMVLKQISKPNAIILAVTAANVDLANSDGLKLAREVDPEGQRTIGVLTKIDLMDTGTDVVDILAGRIIPLRLGYVPVVNRGQRDIENKKQIGLALKAEKEFFENHPSYRNKASYCGTPYLARKLNLILMMHIKQTLPDIKTRITTSLQKYTQELEQLGAGDLLGNNSSNIILNIITEFANEYRTVLDGNSSELSSNELSGGARISFVYHELYSNGIKAIDPFEQVKDIDIRTILYNSSGSSPALFVGTTAFELIVKQQIRRLEEPSLKCVSLVYDELVRILGQLLQKQLFRRYPGLKERFHGVVISFFRKAMDPTNKLVKDLVAMEACYINTGHPDFLNGHRAMAIVNDRHNASKPTQVDPKTGKPLPPSVPPRAGSPSLPTDGSEPNSGFFGSFFASKNKKKMAAMEPPPATLKASGTLSERENQEVEVIKLLINSYFNITRRTMIDMVPKAIMLTLVQYTKDEMQRELLEHMYKAQELDELLKESDYTIRRRKECQQMVESLGKASEIVSQVQ